MTCSSLAARPESTVAPSWVSKIACDRAPRCTILCASPRSSSLQIESVADGCDTPMARATPDTPPRRPWR